MAHPNPIIYSDYSDCPDFLNEFLIHLKTIRGLSLNTVDAYYMDIKLFLKFIIQHNKNAVNNDTIDQVNIKNCDINLLSKISQRDILAFLVFLMEKRNNSPSSRARRLTSIRTFFRYMTVKTHQLDFDPCEGIELPKNKKRLPKYLSLEECYRLLSSVNSDFPSRDYCILVLFLHCGIRLSELIGIDLYDIHDDIIKIIGKGNKERNIYLNNVCLEALDQYIQERNLIISPASESALFISKKRKTRLTARRVQQIIKDCLKAAGLDGQGYSPHKLRHTAATLLYQSGAADILTLKAILGHENISTTEIYTHISDEKVKKAAKSSPLASFKK